MYKRPHGIRLLYAIASISTIIWFIAKYLI